MGEYMGGLESEFHVLIVDDHEINRRIVSLFLKPTGWLWTMACNGEEAVAYCHARRFDVILMDMLMPGLDGLAATCRIRANGQNRDTPVIALTANAMDEHKAKWAEIGVHDFMTKPVDADALLTAIAAKLPQPRKVSA
jgi:two-component system, sensor histidine kinase